MVNLQAARAPHTPNPNAFALTILVYVATDSPPQLQQLLRAQRTRHGLQCYYIKRTAPAFEAVTAQTYHYSFFAPGVQYTRYSWDRQYVSLGTDIAVSFRTLGISKNSKVAERRSVETPLSIGKIKYYRDLFRERGRGRA